MNIKPLQDYMKCKKYILTLIIPYMCSLNC